MNWTVKNDCERANKADNSRQEFGILVLTKYISQQLNSKRSPCPDFLGLPFTFFPLAFRQWPTFLLQKQTSQQLPQRSGWCGVSLFCAGKDSGWGTRVRSLWVDGSQRDRVWWGWIQWTQAECQAGRRQRPSGEGMTTCPM